jgi:hypothetical protein
MAAFRACLLRGVFGKRWEDKGVVLEKTAGGKTQVQCANLFRDNAARVRDDAFCGLAQKKGCAAPKAVVSGENLGAHARQSGVDGVGGNGTRGDIYDFVALIHDEKADGKGFALVAGTLEMRGNFRTVKISARGGVAGVNGDFDASDTVQKIADGVGFPRQLRGGGKILILAAATNAEEGAVRSDAFWRGTQDADEVGAGEVVGIVPDASEDTFAREGEGEHDDPTAHAPETVAEVRECLDFNLNFFVISERGRVEPVGDLAESDFWMRVRAHWTGIIGKARVLKSGKAANLAAGGGGEVFAGRRFFC